MSSSQKIKKPKKDIKDEVIDLHKNTILSLRHGKEHINETLRKLQELNGDLVRMVKLR